MTYLRVTLLGTGGSVPTPRRGMPGIAIQRGAEVILFDCGEGSQRSMITAGIGLTRKMTIVLTHLHGDHILGVPGLMQTMSLLGRRRKLQIYGPEGTKDFVEATLRTVRFELKFPVEVTEVGGGLVYRGRGYEVRSARTDHVVPNLALALIESKRPGKFYPERAEALGIPRGPLWHKLQHGISVRLPDGRLIRPSEVTGPPRPGRKIVYSGDTRPSKSLIELARGADLFICDSTFDDALASKAEETGHLTASQAATIAKEAGVKRLILVHLSARYDDPTILLEQARSIFENVQVGEDLMTIEIPYPET